MDKQEQARHMYFAQAKTQKEIAHILDVSEKTIYNWIKRHSWDQLRQAARQAPAMITENLCSQLVELQNSIARREPGSRYATEEESRIMMRLINMLDKMKKFPGLAMNMQVMTTFSNWASTRDKDFTRNLSLYSGLFLQGYAKNGYHPYDLEFGIEKINPIDPSYFEEEPQAEKPKPGSKHDNMGSQDNESQQPENLPVEVIQGIDNQPTCGDNNSFPPPEKTGKTPAIPSTENHTYPWQTWLPELLKQREQAASNDKSRTHQKE